MRSLLVSEPDVITIPDQTIQHQDPHQQATEVATIFDEDDNDSLESILKESHSSHHHLSSHLCKQKRSNLGGKIKGIYLNYLIIKFLKISQFNLSSTTIKLCYVQILHKP